MSDKELLELAAKAAGITCPDFAIAQYDPIKGFMTNFYSDWWNPLTDDGDALRLAVKLRLTINPYMHGLFVSRDMGEPIISEKWLKDGCATTRRAIVRLAAEIGKTTSQPTAPSPATP